MRPTLFTNATYTLILYIPYDLWSLYLVLSRPAVHFDKYTGRSRSEVRMVVVGQAVRLALDSIEIKNQNWSWNIKDQRSTHDTTSLACRGTFAIHADISAWNAAWLQVKFDNNTVGWIKKSISKVIYTNDWSFIQNKNFFWQISAC